MTLNLSIEFVEENEKVFFEKNPNFLDDFIFHFGMTLGEDNINILDSEGDYCILDVVLHVIEEKDIIEIIDDIEDFMFMEYSIEEPYEYLRLYAKESEHQVIINKYVHDFSRRKEYNFYNRFKNGSDLFTSIYKRKLMADEEYFAFPVKYSPEMKAYIREVRQVLDSLYGAKAVNQFYAKSLFISIDDGWGYTAFLKALSDEIAVYYSEGETKNYSEFSFKASMQDDIFREWEDDISMIKRVSAELVKTNRFGVIAYDLSNWMDQISNPYFLNILRKIGQYSKNILLVFRVPYMDVKAVRRLEGNISNALAIRSMIVPPVSNENMITYLKAKWMESSFIAGKECDDLLEQWICQEKNEGSFYGYKTLDKMAGELIYNKALREWLHAKEGECIKITPTDVKAMLNDEFSDEDPYQVLNGLIGMAQVKKKIHELVAQIKMQKSLEEKGKSIAKPSLNMLFLGSPGTGKTTVARLVGQIFRQEGILRKGHFIEKTGNDFVARFVGEAVQKARIVIQDAYGSVLFVDEAYGMHIGTLKGSTADEVIPIFVAEMENHRDDLCVIFAGYQDEMQEFLKQNAGLESRFSHIIEFPNYSKEELNEIFFKLVDGKFEYDEELREIVTEYINNIPEESFLSKEFSNARFVRNLYENLWGKAAYRISLSGEEELRLKKADMISVMEEEDLKDMMGKNNNRKIGYRVNE